jgi:phosphohistidine phosphatase
MKLYLMRHGDYVINEFNQDVLSEKGINEVKQVANFLRPLQIHVSNILHSGKMRAEQTAQLLSSSVKCDEPIKAQSGLNPNDEAKRFADKTIHESEDLLIVGHLPFMGRLVGQLAAGNENREIVDFHTSTIVCLKSLDKTRWIIEWVWNPGLGI